MMILASSPALAQPASVKAASQTFEAELDALFVKDGLTADQAASRASAASPTVRASAARIDIAIAQAETAELVRIPRVGATATYTRLSPLDPLSLGEGGPVIGFLENTYAVQAQVGVAISDYIVRYPKLIAAARLGTEAARVTKLASEIDASQDTRVAYYEWVRSKLQVMVARRQLTQVRGTLGQVRALAEAQRVSTADRMRVESQEAQAEQVVDQLEQLSELREEQLRMLIGAPSGQRLSIGEDIRAEMTAPAAADLDQLLATAKQQRLEFRAFDVGIRAKEYQRQAERAALFPQLSAFANIDYARPNQRVFPQRDEFQLTWAAGLQLSWTLNDALVSRASSRRIAAETRELVANRENLERGTRLAVLSAQQAVALAQHALLTSQKGLVAAEESYRVRQALLAAQRATAVELVDAETELTRARITALNARIDLRVASAQLAHALGNDVPRR
ncbi:MAG: TolC family protein [Kofleriaceae bacterium]